MSRDIEGGSDAGRDLATLMGIAVTDFRYKDVIAHGNGPQKKVIAQQVEKIFPQAVSKHTDAVAGHLPASRLQRRLGGIGYGT